MISIYKNNPTEGEQDGYRVSKSILENLINNANKGESRIMTTNPAFFYAGMQIMIESEYAIVNKVLDDFVYLANNLIYDHTAGETIRNYANSSNPIVLKEINKTQLLAIRADDNYICMSPVTVSVSGDMENHFQLSKDNVNWSNKIIFHDLKDKNQLLYVKANNGTVKEETVYLKIECSIVGGK